jgi:hypothetical protein
MTALAFAASPMRQAATLVLSGLTIVEKYLIRGGMTSGYFFDVV